jgi:hypothetical protein
MGHIFYQFAKRLAALCTVVQISHMARLGKKKQPALDDGTQQTGKGRHHGGGLAAVLVEYPDQHQSWQRKAHTEHGQFENAGFRRASL